MKQFPCPWCYRIVRKFCRKFCQRREIEIRLEELKESQADMDKIYDEVMDACNRISLYNEKIGDRITYLEKQLKEMK